uniref:Uncharacterized protein n=1 Tax=Cacopsylla melanoneura TaxID=428564 RepID=A0A8D9BH39_9HEMI
MEKNPATQNKTIKKVHAVYFYVTPHDCLQKHPCRYFLSFTGVCHFEFYQFYLKKEKKKRGASLAPGPPPPPFPGVLFPPPPFEKKKKKKKKILILSFIKFKRSSKPLRSTFYFFINLVTIKRGFARNEIKKSKQKHHKKVYSLQLSHFSECQV